MAQQENRHAALLRPQGQTAAGRQVQGTDKAMKLSNHGGKRRAAGAFLHRPQGLFRPAGKNKDDPGRIKSELPQTRGMRQTGLTPHQWITHPEQVPRP